MMKKLQITLGNKTFYTLIAIAFVLIVAGIAYALNSGNYLVHGHTADEIDLTNVCLKNGTNCPSLGGSDYNIIRGAVNSNGTKDYGAGFTSSLTSTGVYQVNFNTAFSKTPVVVTSNMGTANAAVEESVFSPTKNGFTVKFLGGKDYNYPTYNRAFSFVAIEQ